MAFSSYQQSAISYQPIMCRRYSFIPYLAHQGAL